MKDAPVLIRRFGSAQTHDRALLIDALPRGLALFFGGFALINLLGDLERFIQAEVRSGHFASEEDAIATAIRLLRQQVGQPAPSSPTAAPAPDPVLGAMRDAADEMDEIVAEAMKCREQQPWRLSPGE